MKADDDEGDWTNDAGLNAMACKLGILDGTEKRFKGQKVGPLHPKSSERAVLEPVPARTCLQGLAAAAKPCMFIVVNLKLIIDQVVATCAQARRAGSVASEGSSGEDLAAGDAPRAGHSTGALRELEQLQVGPTSLHSFRGVKQQGAAMRIGGAWS